MNWRHLQAFLWLRWRVLYNQWRRAGRLNAVIMVIVAVSILLMAVPCFVGSFIAGQYLIPRAAPAHLMYAWDALVLGFLAFWGIGLVTELQRTEPLSLSKFLHLPVSANEAFLINYISSLLRLSMIIFLPAMLGFCAALVWVKGLALLPSFALVAAFILMVSALSYQFQGWLAALMSNPRRRRTVVVVTTMMFVLAAQLPNLINMFAPWRPNSAAERAAAAKELAELNEAFVSQRISEDEYVQRHDELTSKLGGGNAPSRKSLEAMEDSARIANMVLPIGWLPLGVKSAAEQSPLPWLLGLIGMTSIGSLSLWRAYRTTIGIYQGQGTNQTAPPPALAATPGADSAAAQTARGSMLEARIPGVSEPVAAIALVSLRSLIRAPEAKMMLLNPIIMIPIFGSMAIRNGANIPETFRPLMAMGAIGLALMSMMQLACNQFGFDREGFRAYVISAARRRDILLGKNLAIAPIVLGVVAVLLAAVQYFFPMRPQHFLAMIPQALSMFLLFCVFANLVSILAPLRIAAGTMKPSNPKATAIFLQMGMTLIVFPLTQLLTLIPFGTEVVLNFFEVPVAGLPVCLLLSIAECAVLAIAYRVCLKLEGDLLQSREKKILDVVTGRAL